MSLNEAFDIKFPVERFELVDYDIDYDVGTWSDPGDYPSGAGGAPMPDNNYIEDVRGYVTFKVPRDVVPELRDRIDVGELPDEVRLLANDVAYDSLPDEVNIYWDPSFTELKDGSGLLSLSVSKK